MKFSIFVSEMLSIWIFVFEHKFDRDVTENLNDLDTKIIILCLWVSSCSDRILLYVECEIVIWFDSIHDSCMHIMFIFFFKSYSRHDIIVFVDFAQLCCKNLIFWVIVSFIKQRYDRFFLILVQSLKSVHNLNYLMHVLSRSLRILMICEDMIRLICILNTYAFLCHAFLHNICKLQLSLCRCWLSVRIFDIYDIDWLDCLRILWLVKLFRLSSILFWLLCQRRF